MDGEDNDYLRTGTAIGFRTSRELCSNYLFIHATFFTFFNVFYSSWDVFLHLWHKVYKANKLAAQCSLHHLVCSVYIFTNRDFLRVTGASCLSRGGRTGCFATGLLVFDLDLDFAGDALPEALVDPELLDELDDLDDDPLLDDDLDLLPDELSDPLCHTIQHNKIQSEKMLMAQKSLHSQSWKEASKNSVKFSAIGSQTL